MSTTLRLRYGEAVLDVSLVAERDQVRATIGERTLDVRRLAASAPPYTTAGAIVQEIAFQNDGRTWRALVARHRDRIVVALDGRTYVFVTGDEAREAGRGGGGTGKITAPMPGKVIAVLVAVGDRVEHGQPVLVLEAMKMETTLTADVDGEVTRVGAAAGETIDGGALLIDITPA